MTEFTCRCGAKFKLATFEIAQRGCCPKCGAKISEVLGLASRSTGASSTPVPPTAPVMPVEKPKIRLRDSGTAPVDRPVVLPGLEEAVHAPGPVAEAGSIPILQPIEETGTAAPPVPKPPKPPMPQPGSQPRQKLTIAKPHEAGSKPETPRADKAAVPCPTHPEKTATHNCMNCGKPICIECVHQHGYYCGAACKQVVRAREPKLSKSDEVGKVDERVGKTMDKVGAVLVRLKLPVLLLIVLGAGYLVYVKLWGPKGTVTATLSMVSEVEMMRARLIEPDVVVAQRNDELFSAKLSTQQELWKTDLRPLERKYEIPKPKTSARPDSQYAQENLGSVSEGTQEYRDRLEFVAVQGDFVVVQSDRQLLVFGARDGSRKWEFYREDVVPTVLAIHEDGILCKISPGRFSTTPQESRVVFLSFSDGTEKWTLAGPIGHRDAIRAWNGRLAWLNAPVSPAASRAKSAKASARSYREDSDEDEGDDSPAAGGAPTLKFVSTRDGSVMVPKGVDLAADATLETVGRHLAVLSGAQLYLFTDSTDPVWHTTLAGAPAEMSLVEEDSFSGGFFGLSSGGGGGSKSSRSMRLVGGGGVLAMKTPQGIVALDEKTGQQKWMRAGLDPQGLAVGPDGGVYATVRIPKDQIDVGESKGFRVATVAEGGFTIPTGGFTVLEKLDPKDGATVWGVRNIGQRLLFSDREIFVVDSVSKMHLITGSDLFAAHLSLRSISPRNGKDKWSYLAKAELYECQRDGDRLFVVVAEEAPSGRRNPVCNFHLRIVEPK